MVETSAGVQKLEKGVLKTAETPPNSPVIGKQCRENGRNEPKKSSNWKKVS
ncbi:MAG: hypothetical protein AB2374_01905 [Cytobacillus gottheilii]|uniref:hypothetical protein n=1 Tax=Cytobacillus gottheilii TaxID=859144 RepID=UPI003464210E